MVDRKVPGSGLRHLLKKNASQEKGPNWVLDVGQMNWVGCVQGAALFTAPAIKYLHELPDDLWCLLSYLWAPGR